MPSAHVLGMMSWCTGLLYLNATMSEYKAMVAEGGRISRPATSRARIPGFVLRLEQTVSHEVIHCIQASLCGYPHKLSYDLIERMAELGSGNRLGFYRSQQRHSEIFSGGSVASAGGICRCRLESAALHAQKRKVYPNLTHRGYRKYLDDHISPGSVYRSAYDFVDRHSHKARP